MGASYRQFSVQCSSLTFCTKIAPTNDCISKKRRENMGNKLSKSPVCMNLINHTRIWTMVVEICSLCDLFVQANGFVCVWMNFLLKVDKSIVVLVPRKSEVLK